MSNAGTDEILDLVREAGLVRPRDLESAGVSGGSLARLAQRGLLERLGRGLYALPGAAPSEHRSLAEVSKRTPRGVVCLLSALRFPGLTTQAPAEVWLAIGPKDRAPRPESVRLRIVRVSGEARDAGVETHVVEGVPVRVYGAAKTVADCFKFRNKDRHRHRCRGAARLPGTAPLHRRRTLRARARVPRLPRDAPLHGGARLSPERPPVLRAPARDAPDRRRDERISFGARELAL